MVHRPLFALPLRAAALGALGERGHAGLLEGQAVEEVLGVATAVPRPILGPEMWVSKGVIYVVAS